MAIFMDLKGTSQTSFQISKGGPRAKAVSGEIHIRNSSDAAYAALLASVLKASGNSLELNALAAGAGADRKMTISRPATGMVADVNYTLPAAPINGYVLQTNAAGELSWVQQANVQGLAALADVSQTFSESPKVLVPLSAGQRILAHSVIGRITQVFDVDALLSVGDTTNPTALVAPAQYDLAALAVGDLIHIPYGGKLTVGEALSASFGAVATTGNIEWSIIYKYV